VKTKSSKNVHGNRQQFNCFGPVENLEAYLQPDWWKRIFNSLYLKTDADVVDDQSITCKEVSFFKQILHIQQDHRILDLACGQGRHSLELSREGCRNVVGLDRSHYLINRAKAQAQAERLHVSFKEGDARKLPFQDHTFDFVLILGNSFGYFDSMDDDMIILKEVRRVLKMGGTFFIDVADGDYLRKNFQPRSWEWIDKHYFVCRERALSLDGERLISREVITQVNKGTIADQFYAERLYTPELLESIMLRAGFEDITFHGSFKPDSRRNQDLGMMERRIAATGKILK
jgi:D-alanine-D-alanine ligase